MVLWEDFRGCLDAVWRRSDKARKSRAGRKPWDAVVMFKTIILSALYNLSDDQVEHQIRDRLSFMRFWGWVWRTGLRWGYGRCYGGDLSQVEASEILGVSERTFRRWRDRYA